MIHTLTDTGVTLTVRSGTLVRLHAVTDAQARRLAWAILADLEPDDQPIAASRPRRRGESLLREHILLALEDAPGTRHELTRRAGSVITSNALCLVCDRDMIERVGERRRGNVLATYQITDAGRAELERLRLTDRGASS